MDMYERLRAMVIRNLKPRSQGGNGLAGTLQHLTKAYNPDTDMVEQTKVAYSISGIRASYKIRHVDGQLIRQGDMKFYLSPVLLDGVTDCPVPITTDQLDYDGVTYFIISVKPWRHAGTDCGWVLQLRSA